MITISSEAIEEIFSKKIIPAAVCSSGETVIFETRDCYNNGVVDERFPLGDGEKEVENPITGPLFIQDAEIGDILKVEILDIRLRSWGVMRSSIDFGFFAGSYQEKTARIFQIEQGKIHFDEQVILELEPMIGVIGTAPQEKEIPTTTPDTHGGNMDCRKIIKGSTLYLSVNVTGALLSIGDLHGLMGDGEVFICGLEVGGEVEVRVTVVKDQWLPTPFLSTKGEVMTIQSAATLEEAGRMATKLMRRFLQQAGGYDDLQAGMLLSLVGQLAVCQVVNPLMTMRMEIPAEILYKRGYQLP